jgi:hypothetical protein
MVIEKNTLKNNYFSFSHGFNIYGMRSVLVTENTFEGNGIPDLSFSTLFEKTFYEERFSKIINPLVRNWNPYYKASFPEEPSIGQPVNMRESSSVYCKFCD